MLQTHFITAKSSLFLCHYHIRRDFVSFVTDIWNETSRNQQLIITRLLFDHLTSHNHRSELQMLYHLSTHEITHSSWQWFDQKKLRLCIIFDLVVIFDDLQERSERNQFISKSCLIFSVFKHCKIFATSRDQSVLI